jgi:hypothetical protein
VIRPLLVAAVALVATALPAEASAAQRHPVVIGIADQKSAMFYDHRFHDLGIRHVRLAVPWDVLSYRWQRVELSLWIRHARRAGVEPLITWTHSRAKGRRRVLPQPAHFGRKFRAFRRRYPWIKDFATWNEANHCGEPTCRRARLLVRYWRQMRRNCKGCRLLAAELLDFPNMTRWVRQFKREARVDPGYWGLHNYRDANRMQTLNTRRLLRATRGKVWLTETGGIVRRRNKSTVGFKESAAHAARATRWVFHRLVPLSRRVQRVYLYHWNASSPKDTWDSALIGPDGVARPALGVLRRVMRDGVRLRGGT